MKIKQQNHHPINLTPPAVTFNNALGLLVWIFQAHNRSEEWFGTFLIDLLETIVRELDKPVGSDHLFMYPAKNGDHDKVREDRSQRASEHIRKAIEHLKVIYEEPSK